MAKNGRRNTESIRECCIIRDMSNTMTFQKAIDMGEYDPKYLSRFEEWNEFARHTQFQYIKTAIENRRRHLLSQWADISTILDFSKKPELAEALRNIEKQLRKVEDDRETLFVEYSK